MLQIIKYIQMAEKIKFTKLRNEQTQKRIEKEAARRYGTISRSKN